MTTHALYVATAPIGTSAFALNDISAPAQFAPRIDVRTVLNRAQSNSNVTVNASYPIISVVNGVQTVANTFKLKVEFTSLRSVLAVDERARLFDETIALLQANKQQFLDGSAMFVAA